MSDDIGPLRPAGERKVFHDRHGHVAGAVSAQAAFAAPWASDAVPAETHAQDHGWMHFPAGFEIHLKVKLIQSAEYTLLVFEKKNGSMGINYVLFVSKVSKIPSHI